MQMSRIQSAGIEKYLEKIFLSEQIGYEKPSPQFFEKCFAQIPDFKKEEALILGDSLTSDIRGGKKCRDPDRVVSSIGKKGRRGDRAGL